METEQNFCDSQQNFCGSQRDSYNQQNSCNPWVFSEAKNIQAYTEQVIKDYIAADRGLATCLFGEVKERETRAAFNAVQEIWGIVGMEREFNSLWKKVRLGNG